MRENGLKVSKINKRNKKGFWNPEVGKRGAEVNRKNKTGFT